jgi:hypothetical protein
MQRRFFFFLVSVGIALLVALKTRDASAQSAAPRAVYVVVVSGDRIDAARLREALGRELSVTCVPPDDARASSATGTIDVRASAANKTLEITFRKQEAPVTRSVPLPDDPARAEVAAVFLAGNLARDEAKDLLGGMKRPGGEPPPPGAAPATAATEATAAAAATAATATTARDDEDLRVLRILLQSSAAHGKRQLRAFEVGSIVFGSAAAGGGVFLMTYDRNGSAKGGQLLLGLGGGAVLFGLVSLAITPSASDFDKKVDEAVANGGSSVQVLAQIEKAWEEEAKSARSARHRSSVFALVVGTLEIGIATTVELATRRNAEPNALPAVLFGIGAAEIGLGIYSLLVESSVETSYETWRKVRATPTPPPQASSVRPSFGFSPLPGGGAIAGGFTF